MIYSSYFKLLWDIHFCSVCNTSMFTQAWQRQSNDIWPTSELCFPKKLGHCELIKQNVVICQSLLTFTQLKNYKDNIFIVLLHQLNSFFVCLFFCLFWIWCHQKNSVKWKTGTIKGWESCGENISLLYSPGKPVHWWQVIGALSGMNRASWKGQSMRSEDRPRFYNCVKHC